MIQLILFLIVSLLTLVSYSHYQDYQQNQQRHQNNKNQQITEGFDGIGLSEFSKDVEDIQIGDIVTSYNIPGMPEDDLAGPPHFSSMWSWSTSSIENAELTSSVVTGFGSDELDQHYLINSSYKIGTGATLFIKSGSEYSFKMPEYVETGMKILSSSVEEINIDSISLVNEKTTFYYFLWILLFLFFGFRRK